MNFYKKIVLTGLAIGLVSQPILAQKVSYEKSEIVMTKAELTSFLNKIAELRRAEIQRKKAQYNLTNEYMNYYSSEAISKNGMGNSDNAYIINELKRINDRIDMLMLYGGNNRPTSSTTYIPNTPVVQQPQVVYPESYRIQPNEQPANTTTIIKDDNSAEIAALNGQIGSLNEELRVLHKLAENKNDVAYQNEINALNAKMTELQNQLDSKESTTSTIYVKEELSDLAKAYKDYKQVIYFANNSSTISANDAASLQQLSNDVRNNSDKMTVVVSGFASKSGSAMYNNQLSFKRTEAVKSLLIQNGVAAKDIMTMHHGVDNTTNDANARRAEVTVLVK